MEAINSFFSNIKDKLTNPFFGTLTIVLLIHYWELVFAIFNFDKDCTLIDRLYFIESYISQNITFVSFLLDLLKSAGLMIFGYLIIILTRSIVIWIEHTIMPNITNRIVSENVVLKSIYEEVVKERDENFDQYQEQRKNVREFSKTIDEQLIIIKDKNKNLATITKELQDATHKLNLNIDESVKVERSLNKALAEKLDLEKANKILSKSESTLKEDKERLYTLISDYRNIMLGPNNQIFYNSVYKFPPEIIDKVRELKENNEFESFLSAGKFYEFGGLKPKDIINNMIDKGLAYDRKGDMRHSLSPIGEIIWYYRSILKDVE